MCVKFSMVIFGHLRFEFQVFSIVLRCPAGWATLFRFESANFFCEFSEKSTKMDFSTSSTSFCPTGGLVLFLRLMDEKLKHRWNRGGGPRSVAEGASEEPEELKRRRKVGASYVWSKSTRENRLGHDE